MDIVRLRFQQEEGCNMLKIQNIIPNLSVFMVLLIVYLSTIPGYIKVVLAIFGLTFIIPAAREVMFENKLRKIKVALYTSLAFSIGLLLFSAMQSIASLGYEIFVGFMLVFFFSGIGTFCYGIPSSIIAELVSRRFKKFRALVSGSIHIGFGLLTAFFGLSDYMEPGVFILPTLCSAIFFLIDEYTRRQVKNA
jgi:MFS family permease